MASFAVSSQLLRFRALSITLTFFSIGLGEVLLNLLWCPKVLGLPEGYHQWVRPLSWPDALFLVACFALCLGPPILRTFPYAKEVHEVRGGLRVCFRFAENNIPWADIRQVRIETWREGTAGVTIKCEGKGKRSRTFHFRDFHGIQDFASLLQDRVVEGTEVIARRRLFYCPSAVGMAVRTLALFPVLWVAFRVIEGSAFVSMGEVIEAVWPSLPAFVVTGLMVLLLVDGFRSLHGRHILRSVDYLEGRVGARLHTMHVLGFLEIALGIMALVPLLATLFIGSVIPTV